MVFLLAFLLALDSPVQTSETVVVRRAMVRARITDPYGKPLIGLKPSEVEATFGDKRGEVLSVTWVPESPQAKAEEAKQMAGQVAPAETSFGEEDARLFVFLFQRDIGRALPRVQGEMGFLPYVNKMVDDLPKNDRVAVFSYDSRLRFRLDFTSDRAAIHDAIQHVLLRDEPRAPAAVPEPSLAPLLDRKTMKRAATLEQGLLVLARALAHVDAEVQVIVFGYGMAFRFEGGMSPEWKEAQQLLVDAGIPVNTINTSWQPGRLSQGLIRVANDTGGFSALAVAFPQQSIDHVSTGELSGHFELELRPPDDLPPGEYEVLLKIPKESITMTVMVTLSE